MYVHNEILLSHKEEHPELDSKVLLLETPHTVVAGHQEVKLGLSWMLPPGLLASTVPEGIRRLLVTNSLT